MGMYPSQKPDVVPGLDLNGMALAPDGLRQNDSGGGGTERTLK
jgi:hypothetical protein